MSEHRIQTAGTGSSRDSEYLKIISENLGCGVAIFDEDMNYLFISDTIYEWLGITPQDLKPGDSLKKCYQIMLSKGLISEESAMKHVKGLNQVRPINNEMRTGEDGNNIDTLNINFENGKILRFTRHKLSCGKTISIADDITKLVAQDEILDKSLILGLAGYWSLDLVTKTYSFSRSFYTYFGPDIADRVKKSGIMTVVHPNDRNKLKQAMSSALQNGDRFEVTIRTITQHGYQSWSHATGEIIRNASGKAIRIQTYVKDVTADRKQAAELEMAKDEAIAASKAKSEFLANMSHEIRTPMNGVLGMAELLANTDIDDRQREFISVINNSASALLNIINDILDFSKIEAGAFQIDPIPFDLKSSIGDVAALLRNAAHEKNLEIILNYQTDLPKNFIGDAGRIRQVITNLLGNAIKFTEIGHVTIDVDIKTTGENSICTVDVKDTGIGISPEKMNRIFEKFTQADGSTTRLYGGTGLGLTISKHIVELMGGQMRVESTLGEGSSFGFSLPLPVDVNAKTEAFDSENLADKRVLIVDDIAINRDLFSEQLNIWGLKTHAAIDGVEAIAKLKAAQDSGQPFDLILLDFLMPGLNGQEFAQLVTQTITLKKPKIIMLSSCDQPVSKSALSRKGIDSYLVKPVRERRLFDTIVRVLSNPTSTVAKKETPKDAPECQPTEMKKQEVLVAEDFLLNQDVVKLMLADSPFQPIFVNTGQEALNIYKQNPDRFPLILMDVSMPIMDGFVATRAIRAFEGENELNPIPIIALTGHALKNDKQNCLNAGMDDYMSKPIKQNELIERLESYSGKAIHVQKTG